MPENLAPKPLSKRALSGRSIGNAPSPSRPPNKKAKEKHPDGRIYTVCSESLQANEVSAHKTCTAPNVHVLFDDGKIKIFVTRNSTTNKFACPKCTESFFSTKKLKDHAKSHPRSEPRPPLQQFPRPKIPSQESSRTKDPPHPTSHRPPSTTETLSIRSSSEPSRPQPSLTVFGGSRTRPPPINTLQTPLLSRYGLVVNTEFRILICLECQGIVDPAKVRPHFVNHHKNQSPPLDLQTKFDTEALVSYPNLTSSPPHPTEPVDEIYGLNDPVSDYLMCRSCRHCFTSKKTYRQHGCSSQSDDWILTRAQRFINNRASPWFAVRPSTATLPIRMDHWAIYQTQQNDQLSSSTQRSYSDEFRVLHQFLRKERWIERVQGFSNEALITLPSEHAPCSCLDGGCLSR
ncbi:hypothetical protein AGABI2DRAFT_121462 [Agaricus bisporus var. bisporus H97]|uniref:hypothetical protein n=1 Tax=Agaricus bisporus var. bisporus (strain H97 / ATCC MYA-4626 / FGSC 10389) TaxID=936046 RepID=UPI00029F7526|nr:hypothetical protein AGABI2DRAFT_121462 [Agaricus bisporus var. bisporus H97]EKV43334.1 hypothetical protein AGABI2DRAFT_121462 [Agaricus bisporus var. bisporus H97]